MRHKNPHAVAMGRLGGRVISPAKAKAARENGKKGGRPPKVQPLPSTVPPALTPTIVLCLTCGLPTRPGHACPAWALR